MILKTETKQCGYYWQEKNIFLQRLETQQEC